MQESVRRQSALENQISGIKQGWNEYFAAALREIKDRFERIDTAAFAQYIDEQQVNSEKLDSEMERISNEVSQLELEVRSTTST